METKYTAKTEMMIRKPIGLVYEAFVNPEITSKFWFSKGSGQLEEEKQVNWIWEMYQLTVPVMVKSLIINEKILIDWGTGDDESSVEWNFKALAPDKTFVSISNFGIKGSEEEKIRKVKDSIGGFTIVLAGLKAWLEYGVELNLVGDKFPAELRGQ